MSDTQHVQIDRVQIDVEAQPRVVGDAGGLVCLALGVAVMLAGFAADAWTLGSGAGVVTGVAPLAGVLGGGLVAASLLVASRTRSTALLAAGYAAAAFAVFLVAWPVFLFG